MAADQMYILIFGGLSAAWSMNDPSVRQAGLWFIALQAGMSYITAGWHKLRTPDWRSGEAIRDSFNTRSYGLPAVSAVLHRRPRLCLAVAWPVIVWECLFPLAFVIPGAALPIVVAGVLFHCGTAGVMKLNNFLWAFPACYPAVLYFSR